jgi:uncharacterized repeat protein (TIGR01451 family)
VGHRWARGWVAVAGLLGLAGVGGTPALAGPPAPANVTVLKTVSGTFEEGATVTYTIELHNTGTVATNDNAGDELADSLPPQLTLLTATATSGTADADTAANTVHWNGTLVGAGSVTITVTARIDEQTEGDTVSNQAVGNYDADGNGTNDTQVLSDDVAGLPVEPTDFDVAVIAPTVTINQALCQPDPAPGEPVVFTVIFSEPVIGFAGDDLVLTGTAGASSSSVTGSGSTYSVAVIGASTPGTVIATVLAGAAADDDGVTNPASTSNDNEVTLTATGPISTTSTVRATTTTAPTGSSLASSTTAAVGSAGDLARTGSSDKAPAITFLGWWLAIGGFGFMAYAAARRRQLRSARR